jgi:hypothetical protein
MKPSNEARWIHVTTTAVAIVAPSIHIGAIGRPFAEVASQLLKVGLTYEMATGHGNHGWSSGILYKNTGEKRMVARQSSSLPLIVARKEKKCPKNPFMAPQYCSYLDRLDIGEKYKPLGSHARPVLPF